MLTFQDRIRALRAKKITHTLMKREQNGFTDLDDFGTVPLPDDYSVTPYYNSENGSFYGLFGMCENFVRVMNAHPAYVDPLEMLCGRWRDMLVNYRGDLHYMPKWLDNKKDVKDFGQTVTNQWSKRWDEYRFPYDELKPLQLKYNITSGIDSDAHFACDYRIGFSLGFGGLLEKIEKYRALNPDKKDFYDAEKRTVTAIIDFIDRHIQKIEELLQTEDRPEIIENLQNMLKVNKNIRYNPPKTFHEVCQWTVYFNCASRIYTRDGAGFQLDTLLYPYYKRDVEKGILDDETAKFLIANLLLTDTHYYQLSGVDEQDRDLTNHLSYLVLEAADMINISCNLTVRCHENCDPRFLKKAVYYLFKNKNGWPRFCADQPLTSGYMKNGVDKKTARERIAVGCNWMCVPGREYPMNDTVKINLAKVFEQAFLDMRGMKSRSVKRLFELFERHLKKAAEVTAAGINLHLDHQAEVTPELVMNLMMKNTLEKGLDITQCAELYTIGVDGAGLAVVADSFAALYQRVEVEKIFTFDEIYSFIDSDFGGTDGERARLIMLSSPRYCGGGMGDEWAKTVSESFTRIIKEQPMPKGRQLVPGLFSWSRTIEYGSVVGATPNGRRSGEPISHGANPNPGFRSDGAVTAQASGIAAVQPGYGNPAPLQLEFDPGVAMEDGGLLLVEQLIKTHFKEGGTLININIIDKQTIMAADKNPDLYPDLVVRVTGFTAYFASLSPQFRKLVLDRFLCGRD